MRLVLDTRGKKNLKRRCLLHSGRFSPKKSSEGKALLRCPTDSPSVTELDWETSLERCNHFRPVLSWSKLVSIFSISTVHLHSLGLVWMTLVKRSGKYQAARAVTDGQVRNAG